MNETSFSINDLIRRKMQTGLVIFSLTLSVASTLFLLLFAQRMGLSISSAVEGRLTSGFSRIFSPFTVLLIILVLAAGTVMTSFVSFLTTSQRSRDIGLMKAAGCPNDALFGYFFTELLLLGFIGCSAGIALGVLLNVAFSNLLNSGDLKLPQQSTDPWLTFAVFISFYALSLILGVAPIISAIKSEPAKIFSPANYMGLAKEPGFKTMSKSGVSLKIAIRSLVRHRSATVRIVLCLSVVFLLVTIAVTGGLIADNSTKSWVNNAVGKNILLVAHPEMINQYKLLLSTFYEGQKATSFNYTDQRYLIPDSLIRNLSSLDGVAGSDPRLILDEPVKEIPGIIYGNSTSQITTVGDDRQGDSLIVGLDPTKAVNSWTLSGGFLSSGGGAEAVVGDTIGQMLFTQPLLERIKVSNVELNIVGVCLDPINNGNVTYVPLERLQNLSAIQGVNVLLLKPGSSTNITNLVARIEASAAASGFQVYQLDDSLNKSLAFLDFLWSTIMLVPLFSVVTASLSLLGYVMLSLNEQRQEFGVLRALGAKPRTVFTIVSLQSLLIVLGSYAVGVSLGIIVTLLILVENPAVTMYTILEIAGLLLLAPIATFVASLYPAVRFAKKPLLETMTQS